MKSVGQRDRTGYGQNWLWTELVMDRTGYGKG